MHKRKIRRMQVCINNTTVDESRRAKQGSKLVSTCRPRRSRRIERMLNAPPGMKMLTSARQFFDIPEMLDLLAKMLEWPDLNALANASFYASTVVARIIRERVRTELSPFLSKPEDMEPLFKILRITGASIVGSIAWSVMTAEDGRNPSLPPMDCNIIAPKGIDSLLPCVDYFYAAGYHSITCTFSTRPYSDVARRIITLQRGILSVTITESKTDSIVPVVVASPLTSMMNILSPYRIYCFYPELLRGRLSVKGVSPNISSNYIHRLKLRGIRIKWSTILQDGPCGQICPALWRRTNGLKGVACTIWNPFADTRFIEDLPTKDKDLGYANFKWRLGFVCRNRRCPNWYPSSTGLSVLHERLR